LAHASGALNRANNMVVVPGPLPVDATNKCRHTRSGHSNFSIAVIQFDMKTHTGKLRI